MHYYYNGPMMDGANWVWGTLSILFWLAVLIVVTLLIMRIPRRHDTDEDTKKDPLDIAKERYAKGDISKDEFDRLSRDLH